MVKCKLCGEIVPRKQFFPHRWAKHQAEQLKTSMKGTEASVRAKSASKSTSGASGSTSGVSESTSGVKGAVSGSKGNGKGVKVATTLAEAQTLTIYPKSFTMSSTLVWQAREAAIRELGWPADITAEDFLDSWLFLSMKAQGILLGGYQLIGSNDHHMQH